MAMRSGPLKYGFVGAGFNAKFHLAALRQLRGIEVAGVTAVGGAPELAAAARAWGLGETVVYDSVYEMAQHVDAVAVCAPNFARVPIVEAVVEAARHGARLKGVICAEEHGGPHEGWFWDPTQQGGGVLCDMGCHSIAVGWHVLTPAGKPLTFLQPQEVNADIALLKWGHPAWRAKLLKDRGVDYAKTPAEDFATGMVTYKNPETGQRVKAQFTNSWMFEKQGLRLFMDGMGPGYAFEINTLVSPLNIFIGDVAAEAIKDAELALEKATASRGLLAVQYNEPDLYGYTDENADAMEAFLNGRDGMLPWSYGLEITRLVMAAYMSAEKKRVVDLTDPATQKELETYVPLIQQGRGAEQL
jgi:predicted dehydrogenase